MFYSCFLALLWSVVNRDTSSNENLREPPIASALGGKATLQQAMPAGPRHRPAPGQEPRTGCSSVPRGVFLYPVVFFLYPVVFFCVCMYRRRSLVLSLLVAFGEPEGGSGASGEPEGGRQELERPNRRSETTSKTQNCVRVASKCIRGACGGSPGIRPAKRPQRNDLEDPKLREGCTGGAKTTTFDDSPAISILVTEFCRRAAIFRC